MAPLLLLAGMRIILTVFTDVVHCEVEDVSRTSVGWFCDEPDALSAAAEHLIYKSAIMPDLRKLAPCTIATEYRKMRNGHEAQFYTRATRKNKTRTVLRPSANQKPWVETPFVHHVIAEAQRAVWVR